MDTINNIEYLSLPSKDKFCSSLRSSGPSDANCQHALNVYNRCNCSKFLDYHMLYFKCDVLLLVGVLKTLGTHTYYVVDVKNVFQPKFRIICYIQCKIWFGLWAGGM
jgi:hypothetical protein